jgi:putative spermidine/putrescine transport system substrate-binding protein
MQLPVTPNLRRSILATCLGALLCSSTGFAAAAELPLPKSPVVLNIVDAAGNLALTQGAMEAYQAQNPKLVSRITFTKAPAPEIPAKVKAMQAAGRSDIDMIIVGTDSLAAGLEMGLWVKLFPDYESKFPNLKDSYLPNAYKMNLLAKDHGLAIVFTPSGPLVEFNPDKVKTPPTSPQELLAWCKANPNKLIYARPANSGPGRTFLMGLPYLLGDKDPMDPNKGWDKTWAFLKELDSCIEYYPTGTAAVMKELGEGSRDMTITVAGWDINPRAIGIVPKNYKVLPFKGMTWVNDAHYIVIPKGVPPEKQAVVLDLVAFLLKPQQQAMTYDTGYFYPGPAVKDVPLSLAPKASQDAIKEFGRPEYDGWLAQFPHAQPLEAKAMVDAFRRWDQDIGSRKTQ